LILIHPKLEFFELNIKILEFEVVEKGSLRLNRVGSHAQNINLPSFHPKWRPSQKKVSILIEIKKRELVSQSGGGRGGGSKLYPHLIQIVIMLILQISVFSWSLT